MAAFSTRALTYSSKRGFMTGSRTTLMTNSSSFTPVRFESIARRIKDKNSYYFKFNEVEEESYQMSFGKGNNIEDNYGLLSTLVVPINEAFRNLHTRGLLKFAKGKTDRHKALISPTKLENTPYEHFVSLKPKDFEKLHFQVCEHLSDAPQIFYFDRTVGAHPSAQVNVRLVVDDASQGLYFNNILSRHPSVKPQEFTPDLTVYVSSSFVAENPEQYGLTSSNFSSFNNNQLLLGGNVSLDNITNDIFLAAGKILAEKSNNTIVPLRGSAFLENGKTSLIIGDDKKSFEKQQPNLFGAHHQFWTPQGLVRAWDGVNYKFYEGLNLTRGNYIETNGKSHRVTVGLNSNPLIAPHPSSIYILSNLGNKSTQLSKDEAVQLILSGYDGTNYVPFFGSILATADPVALAQNLRSLIETSKAQLYAVDPASDIGKASKSQALSSSTLEKIQSYVSKTFPKFSQQ